MYYYNSGLWDWVSIRLQLLRTSIDDSLSFTPHFQQLVKKLNCGFYFRLKVLLVLWEKKETCCSQLFPVLCLYLIIAMRFICILKYAGFYHGALKFITNSKTLTHHSFVGLLCHDVYMIYMTDIFLLIRLFSVCPHLISQDLFRLSISKLHTKFEKKKKSIQMCSFLLLESAAESIKTQEAGLT